jgi:hypothetical protein
MKPKRPARTQDTMTTDVVRLANLLAQLQQRRRTQLRALRETNGLIKQRRRELKALAASMANFVDPFDQMPPTRFDEK